MSRTVAYALDFVLDTQDNSPDEVPLQQLCSSLVISGISFTTDLSNSSSPVIQPSSLRTQVSSHAEYEADAWISVFNVALSLSRVIKVYGEAFAFWEQSRLSCGSSSACALSPQTSVRDLFLRPFNEGAILALIEFPLQGRIMGLQGPPYPWPAPLDRCGLLSFFRGEVEKSPYEGAHLLSMVKELLYVSCYPSRDCAHTRGRAKRVSERMVDDVSFERVVKDISHFRAPESTSDTGVYELMDEAYNEVDPFTFYNTRNKRKETEVILKNRPPKKTGVKDPVLTEISKHVPEVVQPPRKVLSLAAPAPDVEGVKKRVAKVREEAIMAELKAQQASFSLNFERKMSRIWMRRYKFQVLTKTQRECHCHCVTSLCWRRG
ncbi:hypothetical protein EDD22DRAFT_988082 [Suillus occidentalis]|nr:hypothetical protein EDD22DRAFT_988082 [Suillus occidentalis]